MKSNNIKLTELSGIVAAWSEPDIAGGGRGSKMEQGMRPVFPLLFSG